MKKHIHHIHIIILLGITFFAVILVAGNDLIEKAYVSSPVTFGVSFSPDHATELGLEPKQTFESILELGVKKVRLSAYWDNIEPEKDHFDFSELEYYINQAQKRNAKVILAAGYKLPRWPECRAPQWLDSTNRHSELACTEHSECGSESLLRQRQLIMIKEVINHYNNSPTITAFQIENEPFLNFGACPEVNRQFFNKEMEFVRSITSKPIIVTDTGELRPWKTPMALSDIFGTTLYRKAHNSFFGDFYYPIPAWHYRVKSDLVRKFFASNNQKTIIVELQAEPWVSQPIQTVSIDSQIKGFSLNQLKETVSFAKKTGFEEIYIWGIEWWYYLASHGHPEYLEYAKGLF